MTSMQKWQLQGTPEKLEECPTSIKFRPSLKMQLQQICRVHRLPLNTVVNDLLTDAVSNTKVIPE